MPLRAHLLELRNRLVIAAIAIVIGAVVSWIYYDQIYDQLTLPFKEYEKIAQSRGNDAPVSINFANATSAFSTQFSISIFSGIIITSPIWLWQIWAFILPGLTKRERRLSYAVFGTALPLFLVGCFMAYITLPKALIILFGFTPDDGTSSNIQQSGDYFSFVMRFILAFGLAWLLPVFLVGLVAIGILSGRTLLKSWRGAILMIFVASAIITPTPDPFTMMLLAGPLVILYFAAVGIALLIDRRRVGRGAEPDWSHLADDEASPLT